MYGEFEWKCLYPRMASQNLPNSKYVPTKSLSSLVFIARDSLANARYYNLLLDNNKSVALCYHALVSTLNLATLC